LSGGALVRELSRVARWREAEKFREAAREMAVGQAQRVGHKRDRLPALEEPARPRESELHQIRVRREAVLATKGTH
jgi:hypothetical protein